VERLARLLHNRIVRRVRHSLPSADAMLLVADLVDGHVYLQPIAVWDETGAVLAGAGTEADASSAGDGTWPLLLGDLRPEFALLARVAPVALFEPYLLDLCQIDLRIESGDAH
jgi:hypothetical protein